MKLSNDAAQVLEKTMNYNRCTPEERAEIEELVAMMPDDRLLLYKNVISNPIGDLPRYSIHIRIQHVLIFVTFLALSVTPREAVPAR